MEPGRGLVKHDECDVHKKAFAAWQEHLKRKSTNTTIHSLLGSKVIEDNRYYVKAIAEFIQFICVNELAFRGNYILELEKETGIFQNLFEFSIKKIIN